jgi:hypothetical protein
VIVPRASVVEAGFDRAEFEFAARPGEELAEAREVRIARRIPRRVRGVKIIAFPVRVPKLDERAANRRAAGSEDASAQIRDRSRRSGQTVVELDEVVVLVERDVVRERIVRSLASRSAKW